MMVARQIDPDPEKLTETEERFAIGFGLILALVSGGLAATLAVGLVLLLSESLFRAIGIALIVFPLVTLSTIRWHINCSWRAYIQTKKELDL